MDKEVVESLAGLFTPDKDTLGGRGGAVLPGGGVFSLSSFLLFSNVISFSSNVASSSNLAFQ